MTDSKFRIRLIRAVANRKFSECQSLFEEIRDFEKDGGELTPLETMLRGICNRKMEKKLFGLLKEDGEDCENA